MKVIAVRYDLVLASRMVLPLTFLFWAWGACARAGEKDHAPASPSTPAAAKGPNLVRNGDFEKIDPKSGLPEGWTTKHPANIKVADLHDGHGKVVEMSGGNGLMSTYGVDLVSDKLPLKANTRYDCSGWTKSQGPNVMVFIKGYQWITHKVNGKDVTTEEQVYQMRKEVKPSKDWKAFHVDFYLAPTKEFSDFQHKIEYLRLTLWAYYPAGTCWCDDIQFREVGPLEKEKQIHLEAVTHLGVKPNLSEEAAESKKPPDDEQLAMDAVNAFGAEEYGKALDMAVKLIERSPGEGAHRVLAARSALRLKKWDEADKHARWLLAGGQHPHDGDGKPGRIEPWQQDWARVVHAEVLLHAGHAAEAAALLGEVLQSGTSPHAKTEAQRLAEEIKRQGR